MIERATTYTVNLDAPLHEWITVVLTCLANGGPHRPPDDTWAIRKSGLCLNHDHEWEFEPPPSSREGEFFRRCRWPLDEALMVARHVAQREDSWRRDAR